MWEPEIIENKHGVLKYRIKKLGQELTYRQWIENLIASEDFAKSFNEILKNNSYQAFFWEVKAITKDLMDSAFEFVIIESKSLSKVKADSTSFQKYFLDGAEVVSFSNLGGDAQLIVPTDLRKTASYAHIAEFVKNAPSSQVTIFWKTVGLQFQNRIGELPLWLSTSGLGVYWLHVRIDTIPKYYSYSPYKHIQ